MNLTRIDRIEMASWAKAVLRKIIPKPVRRTIWSIRIKIRNFRNRKKMVISAWVKYTADARLPEELRVMNDEDTVKATQKRAEESKPSPCFTRDQAIMYNLATFLLWKYLLKIGLGRYLSNLSEPAEGNPISVQIDGKDISQDFNSFSEIEKDFNESNLIFLMPWQMEMLPPKIIDGFMAVDSLHEMRLDEIKRYFLAVDRITKKYLYFKCWKDFYNSEDDTHLTEKSYPVLSRWYKLYSRECRVQTKYFEALYDLTD